MPLAVTTIPRWTLINALQEAANAYDQAAQASAADAQLARQYDRQAIAARRIAEELENTDRVELHD